MSGRMVSHKGWAVLCGLAVCMGVVCAAGFLAGCDEERGEEKAPAHTEALSVGNIRIRVQVDMVHVTVAEAIAWRAEVVRPEAARVTFPDLDGAGGTDGADGDWEVGAMRLVARHLRPDGLVQEVWERMLHPFLPGEAMVPPFRVEVVDAEGERHRRMTSPIAVRVDSVVPEGEREALAFRGLFPVERVGGGWLWRARLLVGGGVLVVVAGVVWVMVLRRTRARPEISARERALQGLDRLVAEGRPAAADVVAYYARMTGLVRVFVEEEFRIRAPELTTEEFMAALRTTPVLSAAHASLLAAFLAHADRVKFARHAPGVEEVEESLARCRAFLQDAACPEDAPSPEATSEGRDTFHAGSVGEGRDG